MADEYKSFINVPGGGEGQRCYYPVRLDPYGKGCGHNCSYCYARSLLEFRDLWHPSEPGVADVSKIRKLFEDVFDKGRRTKWSELLQRRVPLRIGGMTDPLQPIELEERATLELLGILRAYRYPYLFLTKSAVVGQEPYLSALDPALAAVQISVTTLDDEKAARLEHGASPPTQRLEAISRLSDAGFFVTGRISPLIPNRRDGFYSEGGTETPGERSFPYFTFELAEALCDAGSRNILVEFLRFLPFVHRWLGADAGDDLRWMLNERSVRHEGAWHFSAEEKRAYFERIREVCLRRGVQFSVCDDANQDAFRDLWTNPDDCCNALGNIPGFARTYKA